MIAFLATTAFFQAVSADFNNTWLKHFPTQCNKFSLEDKFEKDKKKIEANGTLCTNANCLWDDFFFDCKAPTTVEVPGLKPLGEEYTCVDLVDAGVAYNVEYNQFCPAVSDYKMQCAGKDMEPLAAEGGRRLTVEGAEKVAENLAAAVKTKEAELEANVKQFGALVSCIERNRFYSTWSASWLEETYTTQTCQELLDTYASGDCDNDKAKKYAFVTCCPATCNTKARLGCPADDVKTDDTNTDDVKTDDTNTDDSVTPSTSSGASTMGLISALLVLAQ